MSACVLVSVLVCRRYVSVSVIRESVYWCEISGVSCELCAMNGGKS